MKSTIRTMAIILVLGLYLAKSSHATMSAGIPSNVFDNVYATQSNPHWCWAASIQMVLRYYGVNITQEDIVRRSFGTDPYGYLPDFSGNIQIVTQNLNNWSIDNSGNSYIVSALVFAGAPPPIDLYNEIVSQHPVIIGYQSSVSSQHAVVATAITYDMYYNGPLISTITVRDPWPTSGGRIEYPAAPFASLITNYWVVRAQRTGGNIVTGGQPVSGGENTFPSGCFIATAAYGSYLDPHVVVLRKFRDHVLLKYGTGRAFVGWYYKISPPIADVIKANSLFKLLTQMILLPLVLIVKYFQQAVLCGSVLITIYLVNRRVRVIYGKQET